MSKPQEVKDIAALCTKLVERFSNGQGAYVDSTFKDEMAKAPYVVYFVPTHICREDLLGILIVVQGFGSYIWNGQNTVTKFELVTNGIPTIALASVLAEIINTLDRMIRTVGEERASRKSLPAPDMENVNGH